MIWKIFFVLTVLILGLVSIGGITNDLIPSEFTISAWYIFNILMALIIGLFYSLGWKKKLYGKKAIYALFGFILIFVFFSVIMSVISGLNIAVLQVKTNLGQIDDSFYMSAVSRLVVLAVPLYFILYSPAFAGCFFYKKSLETFSEISKPYWKIFLTYIAASSLIFVFSTLTMINYSDTNIWDFVFLLFVIIKILFSIGFAYNIKLGSQIIWKILLFPYIAAVLLEPFICSEAFLNVTGDNLLLDSYSAVVFNFFINAAAFYALYRYAFKPEVYK